MKKLNITLFQSVIAVAILALTVATIYFFLVTFPKINSDAVNLATLKEKGITSQELAKTREQCLEFKYGSTSTTSGTDGGRLGVISTSSPDRSQIDCH